MPSPEIELCLHHKFELCLLHVNSSYQKDLQTAAVAGRWRYPNSLTLNQKSELYLPQKKPTSKVKSWGSIYTRFSKQKLWSRPSLNNFNLNFYLLGYGADFPAKNLLFNMSYLKPTLTSIYLIYSTLISSNIYLYIFDLLLQYPCQHGLYAHMARRV
jgi:hypothetical protein